MQSGRLRHSRPGAHGSGLPKPPAAHPSGTGAGSEDWCALAPGEEQVVATCCCGARVRGRLGHLAHAHRGAEGRLIGSELDVDTDRRRCASVHSIRRRRVAAHRAVSCDSSQQRARGAAGSGASTHVERRARLVQRWLGHDAASVGALKTGRSGQPTAGRVCFRIFLLNVFVHLPWLNS